MSGAQAFEMRVATLAELNRQAQRLVGVTIVAVEPRPHNDACDSANVIRLTARDGRTFDIQGGYDGWTGHSCDEYVETISVTEIPECLHDWLPVPAGMWPPVQTCAACGWQRPA